MRKKHIRGTFFQNKMKKSSQFPFSKVVSSRPSRSSFPVFYQTSSLGSTQNLREFFVTLNTVGQLLDTYT